jgi:hypothetical protein
MIYYEFPKFLQNHHKTILMPLFIWVNDIAFKPSSFLELLPEALGRDLQRRGHRSSLKPTVGDSSAAIEGLGSTRRSPRSCWCPCLAPRGSEASRPRRQWLAAAAAPVVVLSGDEDDQRRGATVPQGSLHRRQWWPRPRWRARASKNGEVEGGHVRASGKHGSAHCHPMRERKSEPRRSMRQQW